MAYIRKIRRALLQHYRPILEAKSLAEAQVQTMFLDASPVTKVVKQLWYDVGPMEAERMWLQMQRQTGVKSLGRHSRAWLELIQQYLNEFGLDKLTTELTQTTKNWVLKKILEATAEGNGIDWLVREMQANFTRKRARVIARTETTRARNAGYLTAGKELPYEAVKVWNSAQDLRTRNNKTVDHLHMNGQTKEVNEYFQDPRSGALMMMPGDSSNRTVTGADVINCRCRVTFLAKEDANGLPIMKPGNGGLTLPKLPTQPQINIPDGSFMQLSGTPNERAAQIAKVLGLNDDDYKIKITSKRTWAAGSVAWEEKEKGVYVMGKEVLIQESQLDNPSQIIAHELRHLYQSKTMGFYVTKEGIFWNNELHIKKPSYSRVLNAIKNAKTKEEWELAVKRYNELPWEKDANEFMQMFKSFKREGLIDLIELPDKL